MTKESDSPSPAGSAGAAGRAGGEDLAAQSKEAAQGDGWIRVSDRLPEVYGNYAVALAHHGYVCGASFHHDAVSGKGTWEYAGVTHWQHLPPAPKVNK